MRRSLLALPLVLVLVLAAGCSGGGDDGADADGGAAGTGATTTADAGDPRQFGTADPQFGQLLLRFTRAAADGDALAMWNLLSSATQASIGPTLNDFRTSQAREFEEGVGSLAPTAEVILSRRMRDFGVGAIAAEREAEGEGEKEYFAYAVGFLQEEGRWRIELGGIIITGLRPEPLTQVAAEPQLAADVGAGENLGTAVMFLDGEPFVARRDEDTPFAAKLRGQPDEPLAAGRHTVVVFADTGLTASAIAWTFTVGGADGG